MKTDLQLLHTREQFDFIADAPLDVTWPLFGADAERAWAPDWQPIFIWPATATDKEGMVFKIAHGDQTAVWVNTAFDRMANRIQYVYVIPDVVATVITLKLVPIRSSTHVEVIYERTALTGAANETVSKMAGRDKIAGPEWSRQVNDHLHSRPHSARGTASIVQ
ncbi:MAG TPA: hypothetical protein VGD54_13595 [Steroidobacteraceae bacterium]